MDTTALAHFCQMCVHLTCSHYPGRRSCCSRPEPRWPATDRRARRRCPSPSRGCCPDSPRLQRARTSLHLPLQKAAGSAGLAPAPLHPPLPLGQAVGESGSGRLGVRGCGGRESFRAWCNGGPPRPAAGCESWAPRWGWGWSRGSRLSPGAHRGNLKEDTVRKPQKLADSKLIGWLHAACQGQGVQGLNALNF